MNRQAVCEGKVSAPITWDLLQAPAPSVTAYQPLLNGQSEAKPVGALSERQEHRAKELMLRDVSSSIRIAEIARECHLSRSHFSRAFKLKTGLSPQDWLLRARIEKAKSLLGTNASITEIGLECGFSDQSHFTRTFGRLTGSTPMNWRRHSRQEQALVFAVAV